MHEIGHTHSSPKTWLRSASTPSSVSFRLMYMQSWDWSLAFCGVHCSRDLTDVRDVGSGDHRASAIGRLCCECA